MSRIRIFLTALFIVIWLLLGWMMYSDYRNCCSSESLSGSDYNNTEHNRDHIIPDDTFKK